LQALRDVFGERHHLSRLAPKSDVGKHTPLRVHERAELPELHRLTMKPSRLLISSIGTKNRRALGNIALGARLAFFITHVVCVSAARTGQ